MPDFRYSKANSLGMSADRAAAQYSNAVFYHHIKQTLLQTVGILLVILGYYPGLEVELKRIG